MNVFIHRFAKRLSKPGSKVVVDCRKQDWIPGFIDLVATLRKNEVHCVFIYDTKAPIEKKLEREFTIYSILKIRRGFFLNKYLIYVM